ncbi:MAG: transposase [Verrucomicrobiota bacterium]|nr:transposase [Verrucomicrobiota bacterium]
MARPIRIELEDACYHVSAYGNESRPIFQNEDDYHHFLNMCREMPQQFGVQVLAYSLLKNHYHLLIHSTHANLSQAVGWLQTTYSIRYNRQHKRLGHLFYGRFKTILFDAPSHLIPWACYMHQNALRTQKGAPPEKSMSGIKESLRWTSHAEYSEGSSEGSLVQVKNVSQIAGLSEKRLIQEYLQAWENRLDGTINNTPYETAKWGLVIPGGKTEERVVEVLQNKEGLVEQRWRERYEKTKARLMLSGLDTTKIEQKYLIWMRVRLAGERPIDVARDYGYADGSGIVQCIKRIEKKALNDQELKQYLLSLSLALKKPERTKPITLNEDFRGAEPLPVVLL